MAVMKKWRMIIPLTLVFLLSVSVLSHFSLLVEAETPSGNITFEPNVIPFTTVYKEVNKTSNVEGSGERFRFEWNNSLDVDDPNRFDIELFFNATIYKKYDGVWQNVTRMWSLRDFEDDFECTTNFLKNQNESVIQWGWEIDNPDLTNEWLHHGWMRIEDTYPFEVDDIQLETIEPTPEMNFTIKRFHLPDNLVLSFEDLFFKGFMVDVLNPTEVVIMGFEGKTHLNLDPITFSTPTITVIGGTEGTPLNFKDIWDADQAGGWNVVHNNNNTNTQFEFNAKIVFGNGTVAGTTWFADTDVQVLFNSGVVSASWEDIIDVKTYATFRLGEVISDSDRTVRKGCELRSKEATLYHDFYAYSGEVYLYDTTITNGENGRLRLWFRGKTRIYHSKISGLYEFIENNADTILYGISFVRCTTVVFASSMNTIPDRITIIRGYHALRTVAGVTLKNVYAVASLSDTFRFVSITSDVNLINVDVDSWSFTWSGTSTANVLRQYTFDLTVTTDANVPIEDANLTLTYYGEGGGTHGTWLTDANGEIPEQTVTAGFYNQTGGNTIYTYNPYEITITKAGYLTYQKNLMQLEAKSWNIALLEDTGKSASWYLSGTIIIGFPVALGILLICIVAIKKRH